jgi:hypothetical protein
MAEYYQDPFGLDTSPTAATDTVTPATPLQLDYYRQKVVEFQNVLNAMDTTATAASNLAWESLDPQLSSDMDDFLAQYNDKKGQFRAAAEALNFAINGVNTVGANFPTVKIPAGLGFVPIAAAAAVAGAIAVAAALIVWGQEWIKGVNDRMKTTIVLDAIKDPEQKARVATQIANADIALQQSQQSPLGSIAGGIKWIAIAALAFFAYSAFTKFQNK